MFSTKRNSSFWRKARLFWSSWPCLFPCLSILLRSVCDPLGALHLHSVKSQPSNFEAFAWEIAGSALLKANEIDEAAGDLRWGCPHPRPAQRVLLLQLCLPGLWRCQTGREAENTWQGKTWDVAWEGWAERWLAISKCTLAGALQLQMSWSVLPPWRSEAAWSLLRPLIRRWARDAAWDGASVSESL